MNMPDGSTIRGAHIEGNTRELVKRPHYVLCLSRSGDPTLFGYDTVTRIEKPVQLMLAIQESTPNLFGLAAYGDVSYLPRRYGLFEAGPIQPDVLVKDVRFRRQLEYRIALVPIAQDPPEFVLAGSTAIADGLHA